MKEQNNLERGKEVKLDANGKGSDYSNPDPVNVTVPSSTVGQQASK